MKKKDKEELNYRDHRLQQRTGRDGCLSVRKEERKEGDFYVNDVSKHLLKGDLGGLYICETETRQNPVKHPPLNTNLSF